MKRYGIRKGTVFMIGILCALLILAAAVSFFVLRGNRELAVGTDISEKDITEFFYTYSSSAYPPSYQRYRFYKEEEAYHFYHEKREGNDWPLTEEHTTLSGSAELSEEEWTEFLRCLNGGEVKGRTESSEAGGSGPWLYLYWEGDRGKYREFTFLSAAAETAFEELCAELVSLHDRRAAEG